MRRLLTPGWVAGHALALVLVAGMLGMAGWQLSRATGGNTLSWGYTLQWPVFAGFVGFVWAREVRRAVRRKRAPASEPGAPGADARSADARNPDARSADARNPAPPAPARRRPVVTRQAAPAAAAVPDDPELAAYNRYLAWLNANPGARPTDYPG